MKRSSMNQASRALPDENLSDPSPHFPGNDLGSGAWAEYRAYELEVFDRTTKTSETIITSFLRLITF